MPHTLSVLIRSIGRAELSRALDSIRAQTRAIDEILVVFAKPDHPPLPEVARSLPVRWVPTDRPLSRAQAANVALDEAGGDFASFLDDDDELLPCHADVFVRSVKDSDTVYFSRAEVRSGARFTGHFGFPDDLLPYFDVPAFHIASGVFAPATVRAHGFRFDETLESQTDVDFWIQCATRMRFREVVAVTSRWHAADGSSGSGLGGNHDAQRLARMELRRAEKWASLDARWKAKAAAHYDAAVDATRAGATAEAMKHIDRAIATRPSHPDYRQLRATLRVAAGEHRAALTDVAHALQIAPGHRNAIATLGVVARKL